MHKRPICKPTSDNRPMAIETVREVIEVVEVMEVVEVVKVVVEVIESAADTKAESEKRRPIKSETGVTVAIVWVSVWVPIIRCRSGVVVIRCLTINSCRLWRQSVHQPGSGRFVIAGPSAG